MRKPSNIIVPAVAAAAMMGTLLIAQSQTNSDLPDHHLTPGQVASTDLATACTGSSTRNVPTSVKDAAYREYGITSHKPGQYKVDHLIPLELGGANTLKNLWPEASAPAHRKDVLENRLHKMVCVDHTVSLKTAQHAFATDWTAAYERYVGR